MLAPPAGPNTALELSDYASKTWSGLVADDVVPF